ncbi:HAMP domain-containing histidine kinase [Ruegeria sp. 2012CJ41-6]|uniref:Signal transduction histidine-protein kinase/phosphatase MprB n=1 Tax=Ruegeria spongiae TaxID=2942209 RepID=A0ABT0Q7E2_9RHOB|nr:HAMP domain-containing sensor histidine kinase [Ruegeria spongiae]MCL6285786.1 HAMP domain-containing histidine kinase [Ruegeria spongiae]
MARIRRKWRPGLALVLGGGLAGTLLLSLLGLVLLRYLGPEIGFRKAAVLLALAIGLATGVLGYLQYRLLLRPITALADHASAVQRGETGASPSRLGTREATRLGEAVLGMAETLQRREASVRGFAEHVTHELKTPVTAIRAAGELLSDSPKLAADDKALALQILGATEQMQSHLKALRRVTAARAPEHHGRARLGELSDGLQTVFPDLRFEIEGADQSLPLAASGLQIVLHHLLDNAKRHGASRVTLRAVPGHLTVHDDGPGISEGNRDRIFAPFFTTAREQGGTGMGLTIVANLLGAHGAAIELMPSKRGARFEIHFPTV